MLPGEIQGLSRVPDRRDSIPCTSHARNAAPKVAAREVGLHFRLSVPRTHCYTDLRAAPLPLSPRKKLWKGVVNAVVADD
jgi:hypothetical protein